MVPGAHAEGRHDRRAAQTPRRLRPRHPILLAAKGRVYDVTKGRDFYGPGGAYANFAGIDCSRALAKMSLRRDDLSGDVSDATEADLTVLDDWVRKFEDKYPLVGRLIDGDYNGPR